MTIRHYEFTFTIYIYIFLLQCGIVAFAAASQFYFQPQHLESSIFHGTLYRRVHNDRGTCFVSILFRIFSSVPRGFMHTTRLASDLPRCTSVFNVNPCTHDSLMFLISLSLLGPGLIIWEKSDSEKRGKWPQHHHFGLTPSRLWLWSGFPIHLAEHSESLDSDSLVWPVNLPRYTLITAFESNFESSVIDVDPYSWLSDVSLSLLGLAW